MASQQLIHWFSLLTKESPFFFAILDHQHNYSFANDRYAQISGLTTKQLIGLSDKDVLGKNFYQTLKPYYERAFEGESIHSELTLNEQNLESSLHFFITPIFNDNNSVVSISFHAVDTSEKQLLIKSLQQSENKFDKLSSLTNDGVIVVERDIILFANDSSRRLLSHSSISELLGKNFSRLFIDAQSKQAFSAPIESVIGDTPLTCFTAPDSTIEKELELKAEKSILGDTPFTLFLITEKKQPLPSYEGNHFHESHIDSLTKHYNRYGFTTKLEHFIQNKTPFVMLHMDLDNFKSINDSLGHHIGDKVIVEVAARLKKLLPQDAILGHLGGDEFAMILPNPDNENITDDFSDRLIASINQPFDLHYFSKRLSCSIGSVSYPKDSDDPRLLLQNADTAMYEAKERGRNRLIKYHDQMSKEARMRLWLEIELQKALQQNTLEVWYQPKVSARDFSINGAEALIRWKHPVEGYISPGVFIPVAEKAGLIEKLGRVVMREVFATVKHWRLQRILPGRVAINLSAEQFNNPKLIEYMETLLRTTNLPANCITFELTESAVMSDGSYTIKMLESIKELGFNLSIDDFGTGYSSLSYLARFPIDELKIDRAFIAEIDVLPKQITVIENIINLGKALGLSVVAEGVETHEQATLLSNLNSDAIQGFHFHRPQPKHEIEQLFIQNKRIKK